MIDQKGRGPPAHLVCRQPDGCERGIDIARKLKVVKASNGDIGGNA